MRARQMAAADLIRMKVLSKAGVYFLLDGTTKPEKVRDSTIEKLCKALRINRDWLMAGKGDREAKPAPDPPSDWRDVLGFAQAAGLGEGVEAEEYQTAHKLKFRADSLARKRLYPGKLGVMYGNGDSMLPRIKSGDAILFNTDQTTPVDEALFLVMVPGIGKDNAYSVKRCRQFGDDVYFEALNPEGDHHWRKPRKMLDSKHPIQIIGRVRWIGSWED